MTRKARVEPTQTRTVAITLAVITVVLWLLAFLALTLIYLDNPEGYTLPVQIRRAITCTVGAGLCISLGALYRLLARRGLPVLLATGVVASLCCAALYSILSHIIFYEIWPLWPQPWNVVEQIGVARVVFWFFAAWSACYFAVTFEASARQARRELEQSRLLSLQAQHKMLRYQINPHFLFNSLNALLALVLDQETERAEGVITSLSAFLRIALEQDPALMVSLEEEVRNARAYLAVEKARFGERLIVVEDLAPASLRAALPSMVLQPLLENSVRYGLSDSAAPVTVSVVTRAVDGQVRVIVSDDAERRGPLDPGGMGVGQANVRERLHLAFGEAATAAFAPMQPRGYRSELCFPIL